MPRSFLRFRPLPGLLLAAALVPSPPRVVTLDPFTVRFARIAANRIALPLSNRGEVATDVPAEYGNVEFPRGSGFLNFAPTGLLVGASIGGVREAAIVEYASEYRPGPMIGGTYALDDTTYKVYRVAKSDTTGWAEWMAHAVPLGAPVDSAGTSPGVLGSHMLWTVYNDADPSLHAARTGLQPLGIELRQSVWEFKEHGPRDNALLVRWRIENKGVQTLDSVYVGVFSDADIGGAHTVHMGSDTTLAMAFEYPDTVSSLVYGDSVPAFGIRLLEGAHELGGPDLGATSMGTYFHGPEPASAFEWGNVLRGLEVDGSPIVDPTTGLPSRYRYTGDPFTGTGWVDTLYRDVRLVVSSGPFMMAPGDTQTITAALVFGWGPASAYSLDSLYVNAQADFFAPLGEEYVDPAPPDPPPGPPGPTPGVALDVRPNPSTGVVRFVFTPADGEPYALALYDVRGRRLATLGRGTGAGVPVSLLWASPETVLPALEAPLGSPWPGAGLYFAVLDVGGKRTTRRVSILDR